MSSGYKGTRYCCYRHFLQGKPAKDSTYCYSHVPMGVIHPAAQNKRLGPGFVPAGVQVQARPFRIQNRTHDYNEIEHSNTLPNRLAQPKVYIQKIVSRGTYHPVSLSSTKRSAIRARYYESDYDKLSNFFRLISSALKSKTKKQLKQIIDQYILQHKIQNETNIKLINKNSFTNLLQQKFLFTPEQTQQFWQMAYNDLRFKGQKTNNKQQNISIKAFLHNFEQFYIKQNQRFTNMLSQAALKQRVIDARHFLHHWAKNNIFLKINLKNQRNKQLELCEYLRRYGESNFDLDVDLYSTYTQLIENRNSLYFKLRTIAKFIYRITDQKYLTLEKLKQTVYQKITDYTNLLELSRQVLSKFIEIKQYDPEQSFPVTEILQFMKIEKYQEGSIMVMTKWLRNLLKYLFYNNRYPEYGHSLPAIVFNRNTLSLQCNYLIMVNMQIIREYQNYNKNVGDEAIGIIEGLLDQVHQNLYQRMPYIQGPKKMILECNYVVQSILRLFSKCKLQYFYFCNKVVRDFYLSVVRDGELNDLTVFLTSQKNKRLHNDSEQVKRQIKRMFLFQNQQKHLPSQHLMQMSQNIGGDKLQSAFEKYRHTSQDNGQLIKALQERSLEHKNRKQQKQVKEEEDQIAKILNISEKNEDIEKSEVHDHIQEKCAFDVRWLHYCKQKDCCSKVSQQTRSTVSAVQSLQSQLFQMLNL